MPDVALEPYVVGVRGARWYIATGTDGARFLVKVLSPDERSLDLLYRSYRYLRLKNVGDERPFSSLRRTVEHEALVALQARDVGIATPRMRAIAQIGEDSMLIAYEMIDARRLDQVRRDELSDAFLRALWQQIVCLREHHIAHRDLRRANLLVDDDGEPWITGFAFSEVAASGDQLDGDVAQLLASLSLTVGAERAVTSAVATLGPQTVGEALSRLQPNALSGPTRAELTKHPGLLEELQDTVAHQCAVGEPSYVPLERISRQRIFAAVMLVAVTYFLVPQLADLPGVVREVDHASWSWVPLVVLFSALTYVGAALGLGGSVPTRLRAVPTLLAQFAASFTSHLTPAGFGGMALNVRYLQKSGVDAPVAASSVGLNAVAGFGVHIALDVRVLRVGGAVGGFVLRAQLVGDRPRRRDRRGVCRGGVHDSGHARGAAHEARARARPRVERARRGDSQSGQDRVAVRWLRRGHARLRARARTSRRLPSAAGSISRRWVPRISPDRPSPRPRPLPAGSARWRRR